MTIHYISLVIMALAYIYVGIAHFRNPKFFIKITPPYIPHPEKINILVGIIEVGLGIALLIPAVSSYAAWGVIALLIAVFPANIYHHQLAREKGKDVKGTLIRLPIQALLILWAYLYT